MKRNDIHHILVIGSGPIVIGQACEFDYSGNQAVRALKEEGYEVSLINPNPATVMTTPGIADHIFLEPLKKEYIERIFDQVGPDAILSTMGGQTALNLTMELEKEGILEKYGVKVIGASAEAIEKAEDRGLFKDIMTSLGYESARSGIAHSVEDALKIKENIPLPLIIRPSFTLGGMGGSIAETEEDFIPLVENALSVSPVHEVLIEESLIGWREFEMEVMRDRKDNAIIVCSIENIDPMGVHTGDSITIAPIQTLNDEEYQKMRTASIEILRAVGVDCGGSNVQFALSPDHKRMVVIEMNPRVSRSSALASKATGFPIARISAKLAVGYTLDEVQNEITGASVSCFEPALDYVAVKVPRFEMEKFPFEAAALGTQMRSVGEALALGRTALEAINKAFRSAEQKREGIEVLDKSIYDTDLLLRSAHPLRFLAAYTAIKDGETDLNKLSDITGYDIYFLSLLMEMKELEDRLSTETLTDELYREAKKAGLSDKHIASISHQVLPSPLTPARHYVDTCAGEFEALTPYCYTSYDEEDEGAGLGKDAVIIVASGPNRIGQGLEFDTCCTLSSKAFRKHGRKTIMINSNPETVSTDYNTSDRLYIEPLTAESVLQIMKKEGTADVVVQLGGQTPLNMAAELERNGAHIVGTSLESIDRTEDRGLFAELVKELGLRQPENRSASSVAEIKEKAAEIGFPVLLRPSFVLGGRAMFIAYDETGLEEFMRKPEVTVSPEAPVLVDQFLEDAFEYDLDAVSDGESVYIGGILQHIEAAGIHSGDSAAVFPPYKSKPEILDEMRSWTLKLARKLSVKGLMNIQFAEKDGKLYIIEVNPRGSRTVPFISKSSGVDLVEAAVRVWLGEDLVKQGLVKERGSYAEGRCDPILGPEMRSTGEVVGYGRTFGEAYAKSQAAASNKLPTSGRVIISVNSKDRKTIAPIARSLQELGFHILATKGTARDLFSEGILADVVLKTQDGHPNIVDYIRHHKADLVIITPMGSHSRKSDDDIRTEAVRAHIPYTTTTSAAKAAVEAIRYLQENRFIVRELPRMK